MTTVSSLHVNIQTKDVSGADTDGDVYLGLAGREFSLDTSADDFEAGSARAYHLGDGPTFKMRPSMTRACRRQVENADRFPVWIRFQPRSRGDNWVLSRATVTVNDTFFPMWDTAEWLPFTDGIQLGVHSGLYALLLGHSD
jgi:hypothetical protein